MKKVLIVDDNSSMSTAIALIFSRMNPENIVTVVSNGEDAIKALSVAKYDIVLTDYQMSKVDGLTVTTYARSQCPQAVIIFMTAAGEYMKDIALKNGANHFFSKGTDSLVTLLKTIGFTVKPSPTHP